MNIKLKLKCVEKPENLITRSSCRNRNQYKYKVCDCHLNIILIIVNKTHVKVYKRSEVQRKQNRE